MLYLKDVHEQNSTKMNKLLRTPFHLLSWSFSARSFTQIKTLTTAKVDLNMGLHLLRGISLQFKKKKKDVNKAAVFQTGLLNY